MKRIIGKVLCSLAILFAFDSCSDKIEIPGPGSSSPEDQQAYLAKVSKEFTDQINITETYTAANEIIQLLSYIPAYYRQLDNSIFISKYSEAFLEGLLSRQDKKNYTDSITDNDTLTLTNIKAYREIYKLSNIKGCFYADIENEKWTYSESENLEFAFPDSAGNNCVLSIKSSGSKTEAYVLQYRYDKVLKDSSYYQGKKITVYNDTTVHVYIDIPENIEISLSKNGKTLFESNIRTDLKEFDIPLNIDKCSLKIESDFIIGSTDIKTSINYNTNNTSIISSIRKSGSEILGFNLNTDLTLKGEGLIISPIKDINFNSFRIKDFNIYPKKLSELSETNADNVDLTITIMSQAYIKIKLKNSSDIVEKINYMNGPFTYSNIEEYYILCNRMDSIVKDINKNIEEISINYRKSNIDKIDMELSIKNYESTIEYRNYLYFSPSFTLKFADGTSQNFYQYFNPNKFSHAFQLYSQINWIINMINI